MVYAPVGVLALVLIVSTDVAPSTVGVTDAGSKEQAAPVGSPKQPSETGLAKPLSAANSTVAVAEPPGVMTLGVENAGPSMVKSVKLSPSEAFRESEPDVPVMVTV